MKMKFMLKSSTLSSIGVALALHTASFAQSSSETAQPKTDAQIISEFLADKKNQRATTDTGHQKRGVGAEAAELRQMVKALSFDKPAPGVNIPQEDASALSESLSLDAADYLTSLGWKPNEVRAMQKNGFDALAAAVRLIRGSSTQADRLMLSPFIVIGKVTSVQVEDLSDGFGSTVSLSNVRAVAEPKGKPLPGSISIRQRSGEATSRGVVFYDSDINQPQIGQTVMLLLSNDRYTQSVTERGKGQAKGKKGEIFMVRSAYDVPELNDAGDTFAVPLEDGTTGVEQLSAKLASARK